MLLADVLAQIAEQISEETGAAADVAVIQAQVAIEEALARGEDLTEGMEADVNVVSMALFDLNLEELVQLSELEKEAEAIVMDDAAIIASQKEEFALRMRIADALEEEI